MRRKSHIRVIQVLQQHRKTMKKLKRSHQRSTCKFRKRLLMTRKFMKKSFPRAKISRKHRCKCIYDPTVVDSLRVNLSMMMEMESTKFICSCLWEIKESKKRKAKGSKTVRSDADREIRASDRTGAGLRKKEIL